MRIISTHDAAKRLGIHFTTLAQHIAKGKLPAPTVMHVGSRTIHAWTEDQIEHVRKLLPKIANGRKTRYQKQKSEVRSQKPLKTKTKEKPQAKRPVPKKK